MTNNKLRRFRISADMFLELFSDGSHPRYEVMNGIPKGTVVVGVQQEYPGWVVLVIYHPSFETVFEGDYIPELIPTITTVH